MTCSRHLRRSHYDDETVKRVFSMDAGRQKKDQQQLLINRGNFKHNIAVLKKKRGDLVLKRLPLLRKAAGQERDP